MYGLKILALSLLLTISSPTLADIAAIDFVETPWQTASFSVTLPKPFKKVRVTLNGEIGSQQTLIIAVNGKSIAIDRELLVGLESMEIDSISYSNPTMTRSGSVEYFDLIVPFGESYKVFFEPCDHPQNFDWEKDFAVMRVSSELKVTKRTLSLRSEPCQSLPIADR